jgi:hypothetical protein
LLRQAEDNGVTVIGVAPKEAGKGGRSAEEVARPRVFAQRARAVLPATIDPAGPRAKRAPKPTGAF